jgi:hypothetical protein
MVTPRAALGSELRCTQLARRANRRFAREFSCPAPPAKIFCLTRRANQNYESRYLIPHEGRWPSSRTLGSDAVDAAASGARTGSQGGFNSVSDAGAQTNGAKSAFAKTSAGVHYPAKHLAKAGCVRQKRVVLASVADVKSAEVLRARPGSAQPLIR